VFPEDVLAYDWTAGSGVAAGGAADAPLPPAPADYRVAWVVSPPSATSGGHQSAFRFIKALEAAGHPTTVYLYQPAALPRITPESVRALLAESPNYPSLDADIRVYDPAVGIDAAAHAVFSTDWPTAYAVRRAPGPVRRFSLVQDFEPMFYARGSEYVLAENSYRLGLHGITLGPWLARRLEADYGMRAEAVRFGVDTARYARTNDARRTEVAFYTRPPTPRRGHELGVLALRALAEARPDITINVVGWDLPAGSLPFPAVRHGLLDAPRLAALYNRCAAVLSISLTNISLVPLEAMAAGAVAVVNDGDNTDDVIGGSGLERVPLAPAAVARALAAAVDDPRQTARSRAISASVADLDWAATGGPTQQFLRIVDGAMGRA